MLKSLKKEINNFYNLPEAKIIENLREYRKNKSKKALDFLVKSQMSWVIFYSKKFSRRRRQIDVNDCFQDGILGVLRSIETFDESYGIRFSSYAQRSILNFMNRQFEIMAHPVHIPVGVQHELMKKYKSNETKLSKYAEIASTISSVPLDGQRINSTGNNSKIEDIVEDERVDLENSTIEKLDFEKLSKKLKEALCKINKIDADAIINYYGLDNRERMQLRQLGEKMGLSHERVRQRIKRGVSKLREHLSLDTLENF